MGLFQKALILHQGNKIQHLHAHTHKKWDHFVKGVSRNNTRNESIRKHSYPHNFLQQILQLRLQVSPEPSTLSLLHLASTFWKNKYWWAAPLLNCQAKLSSLLFPSYILFCMRTNRVFIWKAKRSSPRPDCALSRGKEEHLAEGCKRR